MAKDVGGEEGVVQEGTGEGEAAQQ